MWYTSKLLDVYNTPYVSSITDSNGNSWSYGYTNGNLTSVTTPGGIITRYGYTNGLLTSVTTPNGNAYTISYDTNSPAKVVGETSPATNGESVAYGTGTVTFTDPSNVQTTWNYDPDHLTTQKTFDSAGLNRVWSFSGYNEFFEPASVVDPLTNTTSYTYNNWGQETSVTDPLGNTTSIATKSSQSLFGSINTDVQSVQLPSGASYNCEYNQNNQQAAAQTPQLQVTGSTYNSNGTMTTGSYPFAIASNPIENNSFEQWTNGLPNTWGKSGPSHTDTQATDNVFGGHSWEVSNSSGGAGNYVVLYPTPTWALAGLSGISFEAYAKASSQGAADATDVQINFFNSSGTFAGSVHGSYLHVANQWKKITVSVDSSQFPSGAVSFRPVINTAPPSASDQIYFDAVDLAASLAVPDYNAIVNGNFENQLTDWNVIGSVTVDSTPNTFGGASHSAKFSNGSSWAGIYPSDSNQFIPYNSGQTYTFIAFAKGSNSGSTYLTLKFYDVNKNPIMNGSNYAEKDGTNSGSGNFDWMFLTDTLSPGYTVPAGTAYILPEVLVGPASGTTWIDGVNLRLGNLSTTYGYDSIYNNLTSVTDPLGNQRQYAYNSQGDVTSVTDPVGNSLSMTYNADHRLLTQASASDNLKVNYSYDYDGNPTTVTETSADGTTTYASATAGYNSLDQVSSSTDALNHTTSYGYDANGRLNSVTLPDTHTLGMTYNSAGEPTAVAVDAATVNQYGYNKNGHLTSIQGGSASTSYGYDAASRLTSQTDSVGSQSFGYNKDNILTSDTATVGTTNIQTVYNPNTQGQITSITNGTSNLATYRYNEQGLYDTINLGNGMTESYRYDNDQHLVSLLISNTTTIVADYEYSYDKDGNLTSVVNGVTGTAVANATYDTMNRLTSETNSNGTTTYSYDALGNMTQKTAGTTTTTYSYNAGSQLTAVNGQAFTYDAKGDLTSSGTNTYKWDELGQLTEVDNSSGTPIALYTYDAVGRRFSETAGGTTTKFFYLGTSNLVTYETDGSGNLLKSYAYAANGQPLTLTTWSGGTGTTYYYHENGHGDVVAVTDSSGNTVAQYAYDAWGNMLSSWGTLANTNPYLYVGYRWDSAVGMYYLNARYYNPSIMRFISQDPLGGMNAYVYASDNPMNLTDPTGMMEDENQSGAAGFAPETGAMGPAGGATEESPAKVSPAEMVAPEDPQVMYEVTQQEMRSAEQRIQQASRNEGTGEEGSHASSNEDHVDLTGHRRTHILNGHRAGANKGKDEFPANWSDNKIMHEVSDIATHPNSIRGIGKWNSPYAIGERGGIRIRVDFYPYSHPTYAGLISTAYPFP